MIEKIKMNLAICECCGNPVAILRGGYLSPEELDSFGLNYECTTPELGTRVHEFKNPAQARVRFAEYLKGLKPHYEKDFCIMTRKSQIQIKQGRN